VTGTAGNKNQRDEKRQMEELYEMKHKNEKILVISKENSQK
jgi:hypothetical protein